MMSDVPFDFDATWPKLAEQLGDAEVSQSIRAMADTVMLVDRDGPSTLAIDQLPLLSRADDGESDDLITQGVLGAGGMGKVELAIQRSLRREVAIKSVLGESDGPNAQALLQEALFTGLLEHPNIVPVHQLGRGHDSAPLLVMKRVEGVSWEALIRDSEHPHWASTRQDRLLEHITILISVCNAVEFAHSRGILHRDIKPANVMVGAFGEVYLLDWGIAMQLEPRQASTAIVGTPCQMAPEMLEGAHRVTERTDVYLLGASLHTALTGKPRHAGASLLEVCKSISLSEPITYEPDVPFELATLCNLATHLDWAKRPANAAAFRRSLEVFLEHRSSIELANEASSKLTALREVLSTPKPNHKEVASLFAECRFGFVQARRVWPENPVASDGLQSCLLLMIERELEQQNLSLAESLFAELPRPAPALEAQVTELRREADERAARLQKIEQETDWRRGSGARLVFFLGMISSWVLLWLWANDGHIRYQGTLSPPRLAANVGVMWLALSATVFAFRRQLFTSQVNSRLVGGVLIAGGAIFVHRVAHCFPVPPTAALLSSEIIICALASALGGLTLARWLWLQVPIWLVGAFAARMFPSFAGLCLAISGALALGLGVWKLRTQQATNETPSS